MSRESRLAKRGFKLKKLAEKRGGQLQPQTRSTASTMHLARAHFVAQAVQRIEQSNTAEMKRALDVVIPASPKLTGTVLEQRVQFEAFIKALAVEAKILDLDGRRLSVEELVPQFTEHLARAENVKRSRFDVLRDKA